MITTLFLSLAAAVSGFLGLIALRFTKTLGGLGIIVAVVFGLAAYGSWQQQTPGANKVNSNPVLQEQIAAVESGNLEINDRSGAVEKLAQANLNNAEANKTNAEAESILGQEYRDMQDWEDQRTGTTINVLSEWTGFENAGNFLKSIIGSAGLLGCLIGILIPIALVIGFHKLMARINP